VTTAIKPNDARRLGMDGGIASQLRFTYVFVPRARREYRTLGFERVALCMCRAAVRARGAARGSALLPQCVSSNGGWAGGERH
jgi:hypothetical protein